MAEREDRNGLQAECAAAVAALGAQDALGRSVKPAARLRTDRQVGLFYFLWIGQHGSARCDNTVLSLDEQKYDESTVNVHHYWDEPLFGYYNSEDAWVFRRHMEMLISAGVDYLVFDTTNGYIYENVCRRIFPVALEMIAQGWKVPGFVFDTNHDSCGTVQKIYDAFFDPANPDSARYAPLWYRNEDWGGRNRERKPWIIAKNNNEGENAGQNYSRLPQAVQDCFYLRESAWFREREVPYAFATDIDDPAVHEGMLSVSVAQHTSGAFSDSVFEAGGRDVNRGRGWSWKDRTNRTDRCARGQNFQEEWERAFSKGEKVSNVFLSTWNEWVAQKQPVGLYGRSTCYFVDQYDPEFSRDIEPVRNEYGDNYYMQMAENIRRFKAEGETPPLPLGKIDISRPGLGGWENARTFRCFAGDTAPRDCRSADAAAPPYRNDSGRNDIVAVTAACSEEFLYVAVECAAPVTAAQEGDPSWMNVFVGKEGGAWNGLDFVVNRLGPGTLCRLGADGRAECVSRVGFVREGCLLKLELPRALLGIADGCEVRVKAADHVRDPQNVLDYYQYGDSAPVGRFYYAFRIGGKR